MASAVTFTGEPEGTTQHTHTINYQQGQRSVTESLFFSGFFQIDYNKINLTHLIVGEIYHEMTSIFLSLLCYM